MTVPHEARITEMSEFNVGSHVSSKDTTKGFVQFDIMHGNGDRVVTQVDLDTARKIAHDVLECVIASEVDVVVFNMLTHDIELDHEGALKFIIAMREKRAELGMH
jgi:hypothetical protein